MIRENNNDEKVVEEHGCHRTIGVERSQLVNPRALVLEHAVQLGFGLSFHCINVGAAAEKNPALLLEHAVRCGANS